MATKVTLHSQGKELSTADEICKALNERYPDVDDDAFSIEHSGFIHEHPLIAIGVVLISSIVLGTTNPAKLAQFTRKSSAPAEEPERVLTVYGKRRAKVKLARLTEVVASIAADWS